MPGTRYPVRRPAGRRQAIAMIDNGERGLFARG